MKKLSIFLCCMFCCIFFLSCDKTELYLDTNFNNVGSWWWNDTLDINTYLSFAKNNSVTEIYIHTSNFNENISNFINKANDYNISVYLLAGKYQWLEDSSQLISLINNFCTYQIKNEAKFAGIHLDIEPHQNPNFHSNRYNLILSLISLANQLKHEYPNILFDYDIPFWLNDEIDFNGTTKEAYKHMIDIANVIHIMSYRDSAEDIYSVSKDEINYASMLNKKIYLGVETKSSEGDKVSFMEEGKAIMYKEIEKLYNVVPANVGINIHHIKEWKDLKD